MTSGKACMTWRSACMAVCAAMFAGVSALAGTGPRDEGPAAFIWDADHGMRDLTDLLIDEYGIDLGGSILISANGISADGKVVWGEKVPLGEDGARYWKLTLDGGTADYRPLVELPSSFGVGPFPVFTVNTMSRDGKVFGGRVRDALGVPQEAFIWSEEMGVLNLTELTGGVFQTAAGLSADGSMVVGTARIAPNVGHAALWSQEAGLIDLGDLSGGLNLSFGLAVSADGSVVVGQSSSSNSGTNPSRAEAFRWTQETGMVGLGDPDGSSIFDSSATVISGDGTLIGGISVGGSFYTLADGWIPRGFGASAISFDGTYLIGTGSFGQGAEAFLWSEGQGFLPLGDLPGGAFESRAFGVTDDGRIVVGTVQVPEPAVSCIFTLAILVLLGRASRVVTQEWRIQKG